MKIFWSTFDKLYLNLVYFLSVRWNLTSWREIRIKEPKSTKNDDFQSLGDIWFNPQNEDWKSYGVNLTIIQSKKIHLPCVHQGHIFHFQSQFHLPMSGHEYSLDDKDQFFFCDMNSFELNLDVFLNRILPHISTGQRAKH